MKQYLPYNILLVLTVALTGLMIFYNLAMRETFAVRVAYTMPALPPPKQPETVSAAAPPETVEDAASEWEEFYGDETDEEQALTSVTFPLDLNRATEAELRFIPQVGNVMAQRIVQYRDVLGGYTSLEQLRGIKGVGDETYQNISAYLYVESEEPPAGSEAESGRGEPSG